jgi:hypothetical protein
MRLGDYSEIRAQWLLGESWLRMDEFLSGEFDDEGDVGRFYAQSWLTVHYLYNHPARMQGFGRYLTALQGGAAPVAAFEPAFGLSPALFQRELRQYARGPLRVQIISRTAPAPAALSVTRLSAAADELLPLVVRMRMGVASRERAALVARGRPIA